MGEGALLVRGGEVSEGVILCLREGGVVMLWLWEGGNVEECRERELILMGDVVEADCGDGSYVTVEVSVPSGVKWRKGASYSVGERLSWVTEYEGSDLEMSGLVLESNERITLLSEWGSAGIEREWLVPTFMLSVFRT